MATNSNRLPSIQTENYPLSFLLHVIQCSESNQPRHYATSFRTSNDTTHWVLLCLNKEEVGKPLAQTYRDDSTISTHASKLMIDTTTINSNDGNTPE